MLHCLHHFLAHATTSTVSFKQRIPELRWITFWPKKTLLSRFLCLVKPSSTACSFSALYKFTLGITQREQGFTRSNKMPPIRIVFQLSSAYGSQSATTMFGRKRSISTGDSSLLFKSSSEASLINNNGKPSAKLTWSPSCA